MVQDEVAKFFGDNLVFDWFDEHLLSQHQRL
jgi:hypothetical protein